MNPLTDPQFQPNESAAFARSALLDVDAAVGAKVVNRTHRVVRERARILQQRRDRDRSLMLPLIISSALVILCVMAVWTGLYQYQATEAAEAVQDVVADANNHLLVAILWFVPVSIAFLATIWARRSRNNSDDEAR